MLERYPGTVAGVDEVGRGSLAGPVVAGAVMLPEHLPEALLDALDDSKRLSPPRRQAIATALRAQARWAIGAASVAEIDALDIRRATHLAMRRAVLRLGVLPELVLVDGAEIPAGLPAPARCCVGGDGRIAAIAAASILAKVFRDALMRKLDRCWPAYGFATHAGYGTAAHRQAIVIHGPCPHHRPRFLRRIGR